MFRKLLVSLFLIIIPFISCHADDVRAMWVVRYALNSVPETQGIIETAKSLNITDLYVQVWALGQRYGYSGNGSKDEPLTNLVKIAHKEHIRVHAWLNTLFIWANDHPPKDNDHIFNISKEAFLRSKSDTNAPEYSKYKEKGIEGYFIDPLSKENLLDIKMVISELITTYHVDGIHLDYFRMPSIEYSFSPMGRTAFFMENWFDPVEIYNNSFDSMTSNNITIYQERADKYKVFLQSNITSLLRDFEFYIKQIDNTITLSVAVKPDLYNARNYYAQDWLSWLKLGYCDNVVMMNYQTDFSLFLGNLQKAAEQNLNQNVVIGVSTYNQGYEAVTLRLEVIKKMKFSGYSLFSYNYLRENSNYLYKLVYLANNEN